jgi:hypothetical protein
MEASAFHVSFFNFLIQRIVLPFSCELWNQGSAAVDLCRCQHVMVSGAVTAARGSLLDTHFTPRPRGAALLLTWESETGYVKTNGTPPHCNLTTRIIDLLTLELGLNSSDFFAAGHGNSSSRCGHLCDQSCPGQRGRPLAGGLKSKATSPSYSTVSVQQSAAVEPPCGGTSIAVPLSSASIVGKSNRCLHRSAPEAD